MERTRSPARRTNLRKQKPSKLILEEDEPQSMLEKPHMMDQSCQTDESDPPVPGRGLRTAVYAVEPGDPPLLQQQLPTSKSGIQQIIECFCSGTAQLKHILLREVDTIFECKLCRSLFRGLPNLIAHKEYYCFPRVTGSNDPPPENKQSQAVKDLLEAIYPARDRPEYVVRLEPIESNPNAVSQSVSVVEEGPEPKSPECDSAPQPEPEPPREQPGWDTPAESPAGQGAEPECEVEQEKEAEPVNGTVVVQEDQQKGEGEGEPPEEDDPKKSCCLCLKKFSSYRSLRRHVRKVHNLKMQELWELLARGAGPVLGAGQAGGKVRPGRCAPPSNRSCPVCLKSFATKANVRRHFDEVHRGLRRDSITPDIATKPGQLPSPELASLQRRGHQYSLESRSCLLCRRAFTSELMLRRHMRIMHNLNELDDNFSVLAKNKKNKKSESEGDFPSTASPASSAPSADSDRKAPPPSLQAKPRKSKLSASFDFKQLYCKLCKRQFTSKQNLGKHIHLHTDGNDIYIKFYRCPLCSYESRRKRDVIRHITVVHKKSSRYLSRIMPKLESRAVKKSAEQVLNSVPKRGPQRDEVNGKQEAPPTRKHHDGPGCDLPTCDICGRSFSKNGYLENHKRSHRPINILRWKIRRTRSKALLW